MGSESLFADIAEEVCYDIQHSIYLIHYSTSVGNKWIILINNSLKRGVYDVPNLKYLDDGIHNNRNMQDTDKVISRLVVNQLSYSQVGLPYRTVAYRTVPRILYAVCVI